MEEKNIEPIEEVKSKRFKFKIKEVIRVCIDYLKNNKYQTFLYIFSGLVVIAIIISLLQLKS